jgi:hypothetical protein
MGGSKVVRILFYLHGYDDVSSYNFDLPFIPLLGLPSTKIRMRVRKFPSCKIIQSYSLALGSLVSIVPILIENTAITIVEICIPS